MFGAATNRPRLAGQLTDFVRRTGIPFFNTQMGKGTVAGIGTTEGGTELWMGTAALTERDYVHEAIDQADLILAIGHDTIEKPPFIMGPKGPKVIHVGYTPANVEQVYFPHAEVVGDSGPSLALLADRVEGRLPNAGALVPLRENILERTMARAEESRFPLTPQRIVHDVRKVMPADGIVALDNGMYKIWFARCYRTRNANALLLDNALATMGAGLPSAMMAAMLNPGRRVMAVCGDGGFMMNSQELETAVRLKLDLVVLIIQDDAYGMIRWKQAVDNFTDWGLDLRQSRLRQVRRGLRREGPARRVGRGAGRRRSKRRSPRAACSSSPCRSTTARTAACSSTNCATACARWRHEDRAAVLRADRAAAPRTASRSRCAIEEVELAPPGPRRGAGQDPRRGPVPLRPVGHQRRPPAADADGDRPRGGRRRRWSSARASPTSPSATTSSLVFVPSCGHCVPCSEGRPALCEPGAAANGAGTLLSGARRLPSPTARRSTTTWAARRSPSTRSCRGARWSRSIPSCRFDEAALFGCAVLTGVGAVVNTAQVRGGRRASRSSAWAASGSPR